MKRVCSYCGADMGTKPGKEGDVTHGICPACYQKEMDKMDILESEKRKAGAVDGAKHYGSAKNKNENIKPQDVNGPYCESCLEKQRDILGRSGIIHGSDVGKYKCKTCGKEATSWGILER